METKKDVDVNDQLKTEQQKVNEISDVHNKCHLQEVHLGPEHVIHRDYVGVE